MLIRSAALALSLLAIAQPSFAHHDENHGAEAELASIGPVVDAPAPAITAVNTDGSAVDLATLSGSQGTIIAFVRSADWCPFCKRQLIELNAEEEASSQSGWQLTGLSYDTTDKLAAFAGQSGIDFPLLSDTGSTTIKAFGLLNEEVNADSKAFGIPHPALVFIDNEGVVKAVLREEGYRNRPSIDVIKETIAALSGDDAS